MATVPSSAQIELQIAAARDALTRLDGEAQALSLPAVSGNQDAAASLAQIDAQVAQIAADLAVLNRARLSALDDEARAVAANAAEYRAHHLAVAKDRAAELVGLAARADDAIETFLTVLRDMQSTERAIWAGLREASAPPADGVFGRKGLAQMAMERAGLSASGQALFHSDKRPIAEIARTAWRHLMTPGADDDI